MRIGLTEGTAMAGGKDLLEGVRALGMAALEPYIGDLSSYLAWPEERLSGFAARAKGMGIEIPSLCAGYFNGDPAIVKPEQEEKAVELVKRMLRVTAALGARTMLLCTFVASHPDTEAKKASVAAVVRRVLGTAREAGVRIGLETPLGAEELAELVDRIGEADVGVYYDTGNAVVMGYDPAAEIERLGRRIMAIHIKDSVKGTLGSLHMGKGQVDFEASMKAIRRIGYDGWLMLETPGDDQAAVQRDLQALRGLSASA